MRLPRKHSMTKRADFARARKDGQAKAGRFVVLSTLADPALPCLTVAVITTRKVGKAHDRNLLRRRIRAILQLHGERIADPKRLLVTIPRPGSSSATYAELEADWLKQAKRLGLLS
ncbi:ribonuclease P protein component [Luteolibacter arcticus]|uniref:Ribonuclease P protein component n=1 Tax=Luteolibacter arcticus TaxID=1581411 RepID=A0ABT3GNL0_9BACT|nr:ribonuclease P protein component [Luteolibacter arcticus]MCW1925116.1 ribonuclease P protein component [Luteolibacter arcticus]